MNDAQIWFLILSVVAIAAAYATKEIRAHTDWLETKQYDTLWRDAAGVIGEVRKAYPNVTDERIILAVTSRLGKRFGRIPVGTVEQTVRDILAGLAPGGK